MLYFHLGEILITEDPYQHFSLFVYKYLNKFDLMYHLQLLKFRNQKQLIKIYRV